MMFIRINRQKMMRCQNRLGTTGQLFVPAAETTVVFVLTVESGSSFAGPSVMTQYVSYNKVRIDTK